MARLVDLLTTWVRVHASRDLPPRRMIPVANRGGRTMYVTPGTSPRDVARLAQALHMGEL